VARKSDVGGRRTLSSFDEGLSSAPAIRESPTVGCIFDKPTRIGIPRRYYDTIRKASAATILSTATYCAAPTTQGAATPRPVPLPPGRAVKPPGPVRGRRCLPPRGRRARRSLAGRYALLLEKVDGVELYQAGDRAEWQRVARWLARFDKLMDDRDAIFQRQWDADPVPLRWLSLRQVASNLTTPPAVPFEHNSVPTLVLNQARDRMVDPAITRRNYERLGGPKRYVELDYGHWSNDPAFWDAVVVACDAWFHEYIA